MKIPIQLFPVKIVIMGRDNKLSRLGKHNHIWNDRCTRSQNQGTLGHSGAIIKYHSLRTVTENLAYHAGQ